MASRNAVIDKLKEQGDEDEKIVCITFCGLLVSRKRRWEKAGDKWRWAVPTAKTVGEAHSGLPACLIYSAGRALCIPHHLPFCPLAALLHSTFDVEKVRGHRTDTDLRLAMSKSSLQKVWFS